MKTAVAFVPFLPLTALVHATGLVRTTTGSSTRPGLVLTQTQYWGTNKIYTSPSNANTSCTSAQKSGFNWSGLNTGAFSTYEGFSFSGFEVADGFGAGIGGLGKRDVSYCLLAGWAGCLPLRAQGVVKR